ncbi:MAG: phosphonate C-P lyase system protein PhnK [Desulfobacteraceae bacterium A6]|nr:MAG: phosphonate C-P lyase system protein PhnK [Desulfobacteraceae bacterium A6]
MPIEPILDVKNLTKIFGKGCPLCHDSTGSEYETNVCQRCGSVVACSDVSFELYPGEILGIVGESGSGKSTVVKLLHFDWDATSGEMYFQNTEDRIQNIDITMDITGKNLIALSPFMKRQIRNALMGVVYQNPHLGLRMDVSSGGNIAERLIMANWRNIVMMRDRASGLLEKIEIPVERMDEPPRNFSGGMQQRVQIAKALSNEPMVLFLDEVTSGLDVSVQARVLDLIRNLQRELHLSMIVVSHDFGVIRLLCQRTMVMKYGRIVEKGLTDQILEDPRHPYTQILVSSQL